MKKYIKTNENNLYYINKPKWLTSEGLPLTDQEYAEHGVYVVDTTPPEENYHLNNISLFNIVYDEVDESVDDDEGSNEPKIIRIEPTFTYKEPAPLPDIIPSRVTRAQAKVVLVQRGLWGQIVNYINSIEDENAKTMAEIALNDALHWERDSPFLNIIATELNVTEEEMNDLFKQANEVKL